MKKIIETKNGAKAEISINDEIITIKVIECKYIKEATDDLFESLEARTDAILAKWQSY